jgi:Tol biopolymer transport system component
MKQSFLNRWGWLVLGPALASLLETSLAGAEVVVAPVPGTESSGGAGIAAGPRISADGRWVVFSSEAGNLVAADGNHQPDVFLRDREAGSTRLISRAHGRPDSADGVSLAPDLTPDGRFIAFQSTAQNLVAPGQLLPRSGRPLSRIYRYDRELDELRLIDVHRPVDDSFPLFLFLRTLTNTVRDLVAPAISSDGQRVLFTTGRNQFPFTASNTDPGPGQPIEADGLFLWEAGTGHTEYFTERYATNPMPETAVYTGMQTDNQPRMSQDGRFVAFSSGVRQLLIGGSTVTFDQMNVIVRDRVGRTNIVPAYILNGGPGPGYSLLGGISDNGEHLLFERRIGPLIGENYQSSHLWLLRLADGALNSISTNAALGQPGNANSERGTISADGNWIAYFSRASNLVAGDNNNLHDVFLHDRINGTNLRISTHPAWQGVRGGRVEQAPRLTPDGRFVLYQASGSGLFRFDRVTGTNALITADVETDSPDLSADGRFVVFTARPSAIDPADPNPHRQVYCHDFVTGLTELISVRDPAVLAATPNGASVLELAAVSATGRFIAFVSRASNLDPAGAGQLWLRDTQLGTNILVSVDRHGQPAGGAGGFQGVQISADGRWVSFMSDHPDLAAGDVNGTVDVFLRDVVAGSTRLVSRSSSTYGRSFGAVLARDASIVVFRTHAVGMAATGGFWDLYGYSPAEATNRLVSLDITFGSGASGPCDRPVISPDGRWLLYRTAAHNVYPESSAGFEKLVLKNLTVQFGGYSGPATRVSLDAQGAPLPGNGPGDWAFSPDSQWLVFNHWDSTTSGVYRRPTASGPVELITTNGFQPLIANGGNIVAWQSRMAAVGYTDTNATWDVFHHRVSDGVTKVISLDQSGARTGNGASRLIALSPDGRYVLFRSHATNLVAGDANRSLDLFLRDTASDTTVLLSRNFAGNASANNFSGKAVFTDDGTKIIFESYASDLVANDFNLERDIFVAQLQLPDRDNDGLPDDWELTYFNTLDRDGTADSDGDGMSDGAEFHAGTSPVNSASILRAIAVTGVGSGATTVLWSAVPGRTYQVQSRDDFGTPGWANVGGPVTATGPSASVPDPNPGDPDRFYRVVLVD